MPPENSDPAGAVKYDWREHINVHPAADEYPLLRESDLARFKAMVEDIHAHGMRTSLTFWSDVHGNELLLDGRNRLDALAEIGALGVRPKDPEDEDDEDELVFVKEWLGEAWGPLAEHRQQNVINWSEKVGGDPYAISASLNAHRRHLEPEQYHARIEALHARIDTAIAQNPGLTDRAISRTTNSSPTTVGKRRAAVNVHPGHKTGRKEAGGREARGRKPGDSPGFDAACERAKRLGLEVRRFDQGYQLTDPECGNGAAYFIGLAKLNQQLKELADSRSPKDTPAEGEETKVEADDPAACADIEEPMPTGLMVMALEMEIEVGIKKMEQLAEKNLVGISLAIDRLTPIAAQAILDANRRAMRIMQELNVALVECARAEADDPAVSAEDRKRINETLADEPVEVDTDGVEEPEKVLANVLDTIKDQKAVAAAYCKIFRRSTFNSDAKEAIRAEIGVLIRKWRAVQATLATPPTDPSGGLPEGETELKNTDDPTEIAPAETVSDVPIPLTPTPPAPPPTPPAPSRPTPKLGRHTKVLAHYMPAHRDPWPADWKELAAVALEEAIAAVQRFGVAHRLEDKHYRQLARMRERLAVLAKADRAIQPRNGAEARL
jgi:hypothetical protein